MLNHELEAKKINEKSTITRFNFTPQKQPLTGFSIQKDLFLHLSNGKNKTDSIIQQIMNENTSSQNKKIKKIASLNYDTSMEIYSNLDHNEYLKAVKRIVSLKNMYEIEDLDDIRGAHGSYILCLDEFSQFYYGFGIIRKAIMRNWSAPEDYRTSTKKYLPLNIYNFGIFDTKRIFVHIDENYQKSEIISKEYAQKLKAIEWEVFKDKFNLSNTMEHLNMEISNPIPVELISLFESKPYQKLAKEFLDGPHTSENLFSPIPPEKVYELLKSTLNILDDKEIKKITLRILGDVGFQKLINLDL